MESNSNNQLTEPWMFDFMRSSNTPLDSCVFSPVLHQFAEGNDSEESLYGAQYPELRHSQEEHIIPFSVDEAFSTHPPSETHRQTTISSHYGPDGNMSKIRLPVNSERPQNTIEVGRSGQQGERAKSATGNTSARHKDPSRPKEKNPCIRCQQGSTGCRWPDKSKPCENCKAPPRAVPWRVPCVPAQFVDLAELGPCVTVTRTECLKQFNMLTLLKQAFAALNNRESKVYCGSGTLSKDLILKASLGHRFGSKTFKNLGTLGYFQSSQECFFRPIAERSKSSTHLAVMALVEAKESFSSRDGLSDHSRISSELYSGQQHNKDRSPLSPYIKLVRDTPCPGIAVEDMVKEATEMLGDFICRETEIKLFRDLQDAVKQCPSDKAEDISSLASRLLRALIWLKSTRDKARTSGFGNEYAAGYEHRNRQVSLALYVHLRYAIKKLKLLDAFWKEVDAFGLTEYLLPSSKKELEPVEQDVQDIEVEKLISVAASKLISQEIAQYLQVEVESVPRVISQLTFMVTLETHDG